MRVLVELKTMPLESCELLKTLRQYFESLSVTLEHLSKRRGVQFIIVTRGN